jgi:FAD/FMN-containing dehydrogenase/Fe-S oxidoreductase
VTNTFDIGDKPAAFLAGNSVDRSDVSDATRQALEDDLRRSLRGDVHFDAMTRSVFATDSSNYRQIPLGVVFPVDEEDVGQILAICKRHHAPVLGRGAGTSLAGQACNVAVVVDMSRYMNKILWIDEKRRRARVQPGVVLDELNREARSLGLTFGPDPATHAWCTLGGMVGNNSCGTHGLYTGKTVDNVAELVLHTYDGRRLELGIYAESADTKDDLRRVADQLRALREEFVDEIRGGYPTISRRVSGYNLDQLLPENHFHLARAVVGSESTCGLVTEITVSLSAWPKFRQLVVVGYEDIYHAADDVPRLLQYDLIGLEGFDEALVHQMRKKDMLLENLSLLPPGRGWLLCEVGADTEALARAKAQRVIDDLSGNAAGVLLADPLQQAMIWSVRESGLGATARPKDAPVNYEGWEDAAVAPENLGRYLRGVRELWDEFGYDGAWYGHFGQGCVHTRNNFDLGSVEGLKKYRAFVEKAADLCVGLGGSISGEHGDGQSRGELLARMYSPRLMEAFRRFKLIWDPQGMMNPGKLIDAFPLDSNIRYGPKYRPSALSLTKFSFDRDQGSLQKAAERCVGVGKCRSDVGGVMCPSYRATRDEVHSTRGRAKLFVEMFQGEVTPSSWKNRDVFSSLELCLSCKGCATDCPTQVDMATYKAEFLHHYYQRRLRPRSAYALSLLPWTGRLASRTSGVTNKLLSSQVSASLIKRIGGIATSRSAPTFAKQSFRRSRQGREFQKETNPTVILWPDTFTDLFSTGRGDATARVLEHVGETVGIPNQWACCGRTLYDSGMLDLAQRTARRTLDVLEQFLDKNVPVVVPEPSCLATFRDEFPQILPDDPRAEKLALLSCSLSEHLSRIGWRYTGIPVSGTINLHPHCHQRAVQGTRSEVHVLEQLGYEVNVLDVGCCGLAGSFGFQSEHDELSRTIAKDKFLPAIRRNAHNETLVIDGFSCQLQAVELASVSSATMAEVLARALHLDQKIVL